MRLVVGGYLDDFALAKVIAAAVRTELLDLGLEAGKRFSAAQRFEPRPQGIVGVVMAEA